MPKTTDMYLHCTWQYWTIQIFVASVIPSMVIKKRRRRRRNNAYNSSRNLTRRCEKKLCKMCYPFLSVTRYRNEDLRILTAHLWTAGISPRVLPLSLSPWSSSTSSLPPAHPPSKFSLGSPYKACRYLLAHFMSRHWLSIRFPSSRFAGRHFKMCSVLL